MFSVKNGLSKQTEWFRMVVERGIKRVRDNLKYSSFGNYPFILELLMFSRSTNRGYGGDPSAVMLNFNLNILINISEA